MVFTHDNGFQQGAIEETIESAWGRLLSAIVIPYSAAPSTSHIEILVVRYLIYGCDVFVWLRILLSYEFAILGTEKASTVIERGFD